MGAAEGKPQARGLGGALVSPLGPRFFSVQLDIVGSGFQGEFWTKAINVAAFSVQVEVAGLGAEA